MKHIELNNFRNYEALALDLSAQKTLITGQNAQGKTNLLEAIYYLSSLDSPRIRKDAELIMFGRESCRFGTVVEKGCISRCHPARTQSGAKLEISVDRCNDGGCDGRSTASTTMATCDVSRSEAKGVDIDLEVIINPPKNKVFKVNGLKKNKSSEFIRVLSVVNFSVNDLFLLRGEPNFRRKWLDSAICQIYPVYWEKIAKYNKIRLQKANLLTARAGTASTFAASGGELLDVFNQQLATSGANIIFLRRKFLIELEKIATQKHVKIAQNEILGMKYESDFVTFESAKEIETALLLRLEEIKQEEIRRTQCLVGPHRDDISFFINDVDAKKFASQGQQRTIVLALKLAELEIIKEKNNDTPVLLLDDVLAELDETRQNYLLNGIEEDIQTIITCTDTKAFSDAFLKDIYVAQIANGKLV